MSAALRDAEPARLGLIVLAAGAGQRLGGAAKALLTDASGASFLAAVLARARAASVRESDVIVVVAAPHRAAVAAEAARLGVAVVDNPAPERGMGSSVGVGFAAAPARFGVDVVAALLWPVDVPGVTAATIAALGAHAAAARLIVPTWHDRGGHPIAVGRGHWPAMAAAADRPEGARSVVRELGAAVVRLAVDDPAIRVDVDDADALAALRGARP